MKRLAFLLLLSLMATLAVGQRKVRLKHADMLKGGQRGEVRVDRVIGNVVFVQNNTTIYCDSAYFNRSRNQVEAFGRIRIEDGDSVTVTALSLVYDGNLKTAYLRKNVVFVKLATATLYTDFLDYIRPRGLAKYYNGGKLVDTTNTLTSRKGYYDVQTNLASFKTDVVGESPEYTMLADTLQYQTRARIVYFRNLTRLIDKTPEKKTAVYRSGYYDTRKKFSTLQSGDMSSPAYQMTGDEYELDDNGKMYKAHGNVVMTSKEDKLIVYGDHGKYDKKTGISKVYGNSYAAKITDEQDTVFLSADTLISIESKDPRKKLLLAYHHVKIFKNNMQGRADSVVYLGADSTMFMFRQPALWTDGNQMTADSIRIRITKKAIDKIYLVSNSFVVSQDSMLNFNQIKGRKMVASFRKENIHTVMVDGNGESIYYAIDEKEEQTDSVLVKSRVTMGMNRIICSNMKINFREGKVNNISFYKMPDASFTPPHEIKEDQTRLKGFVWRAAERPTREQVITRKRPAKTP
ncbi:MAG: Organic solvent tolerance protein OstA [Cyclobacteriaceae bacterium]|nr:Organic solvent tolerance protein OstA [Cyclobacteriaceae bacterium]